MRGFADQQHHIQKSSLQSVTLVNTKLLKSLRFSDPEFPYLYIGDDIYFAVEGLMDNICILEVSMSMRCIE